jgi:hypothetical protein
MDSFKSQNDVRCAKCGAVPNNIVWDYDFDYDTNDRVHEYGKYICQCGYDEQFSTNDPYKGEE